MLTDRITARSIIAGDVIIQSGCRYRAIASAEQSGRDEVTVPCRIIRGNGAILPGRNISLRFGDMSPVDVIAR